MRFIVYFLCALCVFSPVAKAEPALEALQNELASMRTAIESLATMVKTQNEVIERQNIRIAGLEEQDNRTTASEPAGAPKLGGLSGFNPEIGAVGTVQAHLTENSDDEEGQDTIALKELELSIAQYVDPYSRFDGIIAFNDALEEQNVYIEEAYYTRWGLPFGFTGQIGKFRPKVGKQNLLHLHQLDTVDYPMVIRDFLGEEGLSSSGVRLQNMLPNPWDIPVEITGEVLRGNEGASFSGVSRRPIFNTHVKTFFETSENSNLELGSTVMFGDENINTLTEGDDRYGVQVFGFDATWNWQLPEGRKIKWQNELYFQSRSNLVHVNDNPWGFYTLIDARISPRFSVGTRFDYLEPLDVIGDHIRSWAISPYITFWQSEFANFQLQYSHIEEADGGAKSDDAVYLRANFLVGAHKHPVQ